MTKVNVTALTTFSHGNVDAKEGMPYALNKGDAQELEKAGFVRMEADGEPEQTQVGAPVQKHEVGDVVTDAPGSEKMEVSHDNKMAETTSNKARGSRK